MATNVNGLELGPVKAGRRIWKGWMMRPKMSAAPKRCGGGGTHVSQRKAKAAPPPPKKGKKEAK